MSAPLYSAIERELPTDESRALLELTSDLVRAELLPRVDKAEDSADFPRDVFATLGDTGVLGLPFPEEFGGGGQPATVYLQVIEELARGWLTVGMGTSVHILSCHGIATAGTADQRARLLPDMLNNSLGAFCLSEAHAGSDIATMRTTARRIGDEYELNGSKAWITHGPVADFYLVFARTGSAGSGGRGLSAFHVPAGTAGVSADMPERKMGLKGSLTSGVTFDHARIPAGNLIGAEGDGMAIALAALDSGRLGIAACATGLARSALDVALRYAIERQAFGERIVDFQGVGFLLADAATGIESARALYLAAARRKDAGLPFSAQAAMAKLTATDMCMKVTTDMVQVLGGAGYVLDYPVERFMREAKVLQILEGTNQIQRTVILKSMLRPTGTAR
ncbi:acyl-CoA dehydrogenase family protein [Nakamurella lactea]|uniref:acyl-CoA dehydrogenase family protein n=1 Tax=Nakamurella lactea TaxID=459515 RepID=UPI000422B6FB|nr:acyl-CoA dehydrogenase family protein [Nakamurella lactea]